MESTNLLRLKQVTAKNGRGKSAVYAAIKQGLFPKPVKLGQILSAWPEHEVDQINKAIIAGKTDDEIRKLVAQLESARKIAA